MPSKQATTPERTRQNAIDTIRKTLDGLQPAELGEVFGTIREEHAAGIRDRFDEVWGEAATLCETYRSVRGTAMPTPAGLERAFGVECTPLDGAGFETKPRSWHEHEVIKAIRLFRGRGAHDNTIAAIVSGAGGDGAFAVHDVLGDLAAGGHAVQDDEGLWRLATDRGDAWYTHTLMSFIGEKPADQLPTTAQINEHIIEAGGHGADAVAEHLPRLAGMGLVREVDDGVWDVTNRKPEAWYDYTITSFVSAQPISSLPTIKQIHDHVIERGGQGARAVTDAIPRLVQGGHLVEAREGVFDIAARKPDAWYDFEILSLIHESKPDDLPTTAQINDAIIEAGGEGAKAVAVALPRLVQRGLVREVDDGVWEVTNRKPEAWYDHAIIGFIESSPADGLPTVKQIHDHVIERGGHGAEAVEAHIPRLVRTGSILEAGDGVYDVSTRRTDAWYDQQILDLVTGSESGATTAEINESVIAAGASGATAVRSGLPRLACCGLIAETEVGRWMPTDAAPLPWLDRRVLEGVRGAGGGAVGIGELAGHVRGFDDQVLDEDVEAAAHRLARSCLVEQTEDGGFCLPQQRTMTATTTRRRTRRRAA